MNDKTSVASGGGDAAMVMTTASVRPGASGGAVLTPNGELVALVTSNAHARARVYISDERVFVYPHIREPYTYNTSTYLSMILGNSSESAHEIREYITEHIVPSIPHHFGTYESYIFIIPPQFAILKALFETKFDELFGPTLHARVFTSEEIKHAKTVIPSPTMAASPVRTLRPHSRGVRPSAT